MDERLLEILGHEGQGYSPLVDYESWRVALLRFEEETLPGNQVSMERHLETDEVFVLLQGAGTMIVGGNGCEVGELCAAPMQIGKVYNVRRSAWHTLSLSWDGSVLIVENRDTTEDNSEYRELSREQRERIRELSQLGDDAPHG